MDLENSLKKIKNFILNRYGDNLAGILIFGSANIGHFREGESDIDTMIFLKKPKGMDLYKETKFLINALKSENFHTQYFHTLSSIKKYVKKRTSWSTCITILSKDGSRVLYSTPEFKELKKWLVNTFLSKQDIKKYLQEKDEFELYGYFENIKGFDLTKALMSHIRRKLQIMNYFKTKEFVFDYNPCLNNINLAIDKKEKLRTLYKSYENVEELSEKEVSDYYKLAKQLTDDINKK